MPLSPCPSGQTRDKISRRCRDKKKPGRRKKSSSSPGRPKKSSSPGRPRKLPRKKSSSPGRPRKLPRKSTRKSPRKLPRKSSSLHLLSKTEIQSSIPQLDNMSLNEIRQEIEELNEDFGKFPNLVKKYYGRYCTRLTSSISKKLVIGKSIYILLGQTYDTFTKSIASRLKHVNKVTLEEIDGDGLHFSDDILMFEKDGIMRTGSGSEPVYIFIK